MYAFDKDSLKRNATFSHVSKKIKIKKTLKTLLDSNPEPGRHVSDSYFVPGDSSRFDNHE